MNLEKYSAVQLGTLVNMKQISPVEVISYFKERILHRNPSINAITYTNFEYAEKVAADMEQRIMEGEYLGRFVGVPVALKDFLPSKKGWPNTHGGVKCLTTEDTQDSEFYKAARKLGAIPIGKTNAPHFGFSGTCDNKLYGPTRNPFNTDYNSGGSSGGTAAAVADGLILLGEGGDAGGSIRIPSAWCNCFGFKPSKGLVPNYSRPDAFAATHPYCCNGGITKTVEDSIILYRNMINYNPKDPNSIPFDFNMSKAKNPLKIAVTLDYGLFPRTPEICSAILDVCSEINSNGIIIDMVDFDFKHSLTDIASMWCMSISVDTWLDMQTWAKQGLNIEADHSDEVSHEFLFWNRMASRFDINSFRRFNEIRTDILDAYEKVFESYDMIISPVTACMPVLNENNGNTRGPKVINGVTMPDNVISFAETFLVNFIGYPAASVPIGFSDDRLPIGMQVIGRQYQDASLLSFCQWIEKMIRPWSHDYVRAFSREV